MSNGDESTFLLSAMVQFGHPLEGYPSCTATEFSGRRFVAEFWRIKLPFARLFVRPASAEKLYVRCLPIAGRNNMDRDLPETLSHARHLSAEQSATPQTRRSGRRPGILLSTRPSKPACSECTTESSRRIARVGRIASPLI